MYCNIKLKLNRPIKTNNCKKNICFVGNAVNDGNCGARRYTQMIALIICCPLLFLT